MSDPFWGAAAMALATAAPHRIPFVLREALQQLRADVDATLFLADYRMQVLMPAPPSDAATAPIDGSSVGRCFASQESAVEDSPTGVVVLAPVTVRGDRLGVLWVRVAGATASLESSTGLVSKVEGLARLAGPALLAADQVTDVYRVARRGRSMTLGAEIQWDMLPGRALRTDHADVAAQLEPAYSVVGDAFDWVSDRGGLSAVLVDGAGHGMRATANVAFAVSAVRNARREGADLTGVARMADQALHGRPGGESFASCVLLDLAPGSSGIDLILAGAGTVWMGPRDGLERVDLPRHPPLGVEEDYPYTPASLPVSAGTRLLIASDGLTDAQVSGRHFVESFERLAHSQRLLGSGETVRALIRELRTFHAGQPQTDDAVVMCVDIV